jgi:hypothetical protein
VACALYATEDSEAELAAFGFLPEDYANERIEIWPENQQAINLFTSISTQWRVGAGGPTGLDYNVLFTRMARMDLSDERHEQLFDDIRVIESEALRIINKKD